MVGHRQVFIADPTWQLVANSSRPATTAEDTKINENFFRTLKIFFPFQIIIHFDSIRLAYFVMHSSLLDA
jgi:hypothetical protein